MPRLVATPYEGLYAFLHRFDVHTAHNDGDRTVDDFSDAFRALTGHSPFPWQGTITNLQMTVFSCTAKIRDKHNG